MEDMKSFRNFDIVLDDSDHYYRDRSSPNNTLGNTSNKNIIKEWKILEQNLPESIYVRVYEQRIDLIRAAIIGVDATPYHDGLFFFDIAFPSDCPNHPPKFHCISFGLPLNPCIVPNGRLPPALLNPRFGRMWDPSVSTCLQLLLSLQALVLNEKPYFNFFNAYDYWHPDNRSRAYTEKVTCRLTLHLLHKPPRHFDAFVKNHFHNRGEAILAAFVEYAAGRMSIGYYGARAQSCSPPHKVLVSQTHKKWAQKFYPSMINAFEKCGASFDTSVARSLVLMSESESKKSTILNKVMAQIKKAWMYS